MKVTVAENEEKTKQKTKKNCNNDFIYSLCLYFSLSESTILNTKTFVNC